MGDESKTVTLADARDAYNFHFGEPVTLCWRTESWSRRWLRAIWRRLTWWRKRPAPAVTVVTAVDVESGTITLGNG